MLFEVEGYATFTSLFLPFTAEAGDSVYRVVFPKAFRGLCSSFQTRTKENRGKGSQVPKQDPVIMSCIVISIYFLACHEDSQSCRRSPRPGM